MGNAKNVVKNDAKKAVTHTKSWVHNLFVWDSAMSILHGTLFVAAVIVALLQLLGTFVPAVYLYSMLAVGGVVAYFLLRKKAKAVDAMLARFVGNLGDKAQH